MSAGWSLILLGAPGSGKGTQAKYVHEKWSIPHISTGDILRGEIAAGSPLGKKVSDVLASGKLVDDELMKDLVRSRLSHNDVKNGFLLDGYPRNLSQAQVFEKIVDDLSLPPVLSIAIDLPEEELKKRILGRLSCQKCGGIFHEVLNPPKAELTCDFCGSALMRRKDDNESTVVQRLNIYKTETSPLRSYYQEKGILHSINGLKPIKEISAEIEKLLA